MAPEAAGGSWWPGSFLAPIEANQPHLDSGLGVIETIRDELASEGVGPERIALLGFIKGPVSRWNTQRAPDMPWAR